MEPQQWTRIFTNNIETLNKGDTWHLEFDETIEPKHLNFGWQKYIRRTIARFRCTKCERSWPSNRVMVIFFMQLTNGTGTVKVRPLRQNCKRCLNAPMVKPKVESDDINILMENLMEKIRIKCYRENLGQSIRHPGHLDVKSPHEPQHCEGCKLGICSRE
ncbi:receptor-transporting protein 3-like [Kryptolebias marmoratus]|uniref:Receptor-transporting protein 3-like n=1 Tax=Kryptolebias marmoratus TaxID=37003 RepID=A0A3Q3A5E2_KRYMA|nr:receptor-transporting protein 3-like [Kryptolebias marmoratus]